jgi:septal ring factor EnvC (AmiA/AmiB activator)
MMMSSRIFMLAAAFVLCMGAATYGADEGAKKKELERIDREMIEKKNEIKRAKRKERSILSALDKIDQDIQSGSAALIEQQKRLREIETGLRYIEQSNTEISAKLAGLKRIYGQRLRALYKMSRSGNAGILSAESLSGALRQVRYLSMIAERDRMVMKDYGSTLDRLAVRQTEIAGMKQDVLSRKRTVEVKKVELETQKRKKAELLASVRKEKGLYEQTLRELEESSTSLWAMIKRAEQEKKEQRAIAPAAPPGRGSLSADTTRLPWPVEGRVLTHFGMQRHPQFGTMVFRRGIEIAARVGDPVRAVSDGVVAYADWYKGYGKLIILEHGNGFYTLYGNLSVLDAQKGGRVAKGQAIGQAGDTGSMKGAKLYFEIRRNGEAQDPLVWLAKK